MLDNRNNKTGMTAPEKKQADNISAKNIYSTFAFNLREECKKQGLSQEELADICDVSVHTIKRYEAGTTKQGSLDAAYKIAAGFEKSLDEMLVSPFDKKPVDIFENPEVRSVLSELMQRLLSLFCPDYFCLADEIATTGTFHTHIFIYSKSPIRFSTLKNRFPTAHIEKAFGSAKDNRDYIRKEGKWLDDKKAETSVAGSFYEFGLIPSECEERDPKMYKLLQNVKDGLSTTKIIDESPNFAFKSKDIDTLREAYRAEQYMSKNRKITVTYLYGATGTGKTSSIYKKHPATEICRITDYNGKNGVHFDAYHGQDVLVFEEFNSQIPIEAMLNYLDIYPLMLPARYTDRTACFTKVYITSNIPLNEQYIDVRHNRLETWKAFIRRIDHVFMYMPDGSVEEIYFK